MPVLKKKLNSPLSASHLETHYVKAVICQLSICLPGGSVDNALITMVISYVSSVIAGIGNSIAMTVTIPSLKLMDISLMVRSL